MDNFFGDKANIFGDIDNIFGAYYSGFRGVTLIAITDLRVNDGWQTAYGRRRTEKSCFFEFLGDLLAKKARFGRNFPKFGIFQEKKSGQIGQV